LQLISEFQIKCLHCTRIKFRSLNLQVKVCVVEPGNHIAGTNICVLERVHHETMGMWNALEPDTRSAYGEHRLEECMALNKQFITCGVISAK
jgi:hypothetical protein